MKLDELKIIRERYEKLPSQNEETVKIQVVIPFLKFLGYQESWFIGEEKVLSKRNRIDIAICVNQYNSDVLYVETKRAGKQLTDSDVEQLLNYLNIINVEWGILTNGKDYLLLNNKIDGQYKYKIVFNFNLKDGSTDFMLKFFTYEYIFDRKVTNYFKYFAQFKAYKKVTNEKDMSWRQYHSTLFNFFINLAEKSYFYGIDKIRHHDFKEYLTLTIENKKKQNKRYPKSKASISNYYRYISGMYETFKLNGMKINNPFEKITEKEMLSGIEYDEEERFISPLDDDEIEKILKAFEFTRKPVRNRLIFLLILYCAMDKSEIQKLRVSDIDFKKEKLIFDDREIPLPKHIIKLINEYLVIKEQNVEDSDYLFCRYYNKAYDFIGDSGYNDIINNAVNRTDLTEKRKKEITIYTVKKSTILKMLKQGFHIEEILYLTGLSLSSLDKYLLDIDLKVNINGMTSKHPYTKFFKK